MTNDPPLDQQLAELQKWDFREATRATPVPGNVNPVDRFVRANYFLQTLREPRDEREAIATIFSLTRNASVPFNAPYKTPGTVYDTEYRTVCNLTDRRFFFELSRSPNVVWVNLDELDFEAGAPSCVLDPDDINLTGNVGDRFRIQPRPPF
jgi:choloylglycine hydrolase